MTGHLHGPLYPELPLTIRSLLPGDTVLPPGIHRWRDWCNGEELFDHSTPLQYLGDTAPLQRPTLGLICSGHCPGSVLLETYRFIRTTIPEGPTIVGGFHSPMERTCFDTLLLRRVQLVFCPARRVLVRSVPVAWRSAIADRRLMVLSPFTEKQRRVDRGLARMRNTFVAALAGILFVPYARAGGEVASLVRAALQRGKKVITLDDPENAEIIRMGAERWKVGELIKLFRSDMTTAPG